MDDTDVYTTVVNCMNLKRDVCIAYLVNKTKAGVSFTLLLSTDTELDTLSIGAITKRDIKSSFLFLDAKQFTCLMDCQARSKEALHSHFNASFTALNLIKWHDRLLSPNRKPLSVGSWKTRFFNASLIEHIFCDVGLDLSLIKFSSTYEELCNFGAVSC